MSYYKVQMKELNVTITVAIKIATNPEVFSALVYCN